jgi:hypothetical protein
LDPYSKADDNGLAGGFCHSVANFELNAKIVAVEMKNMREIMANPVHEASIFDMKRVVNDVGDVQN